MFVSSHRSTRTLTEKVPETKRSSIFSIASKSSSSRSILRESQASSKMPSRTEVRQFKCATCPGKYEWHPYRLWHERVKISSNPVSQCHVCKKNKKAVPKGDEEGVHVCCFECKCGHRYNVVCEMRDTAKCYSCKEKMVSPFGFLPRLRINKKSDNTHSCSKCNGVGNCPNLRHRDEELRMLKAADCA